MAKLKLNPATGELQLIDILISIEYAFGMAGNVKDKDWLYRPPGNIPTNKTGHTVGFVNPVIKKVTTANENLNTYDLEIYEHEGDEINLTLLETLNIVNKRSETFDICVAVTQGRQLAIRLVNGSARNIGVDISLDGDFV